MLVKTIIDEDLGAKWEILQEGEDSYRVKYFEYYQSCGWRFISDDVCSREVIEDMFDVSL